MRLRLNKKTMRRCSTSMQVLKLFQALSMRVFRQLFCPSNQVSALVSSIKAKELTWLSQDKALFQQDPYLVEEDQMRAWIACSLLHRLQVVVLSLTKALGVESTLSVLSANSKKNLKLKRYLRKHSLKERQDFSNGTIFKTFKFLLIT